jgi:hypothetical protein
MSKGRERKRVRKHHSSKERRRQSGDRRTFGKVKPNQSRAQVQTLERGTSAKIGGARAQPKIGSQRSWTEDFLRGEAPKLSRVRVSLERKHRRKWTVNRSPHGNKTARDQLGREDWKRSRSREETKKGDLCLAKGKSNQSRGKRRKPRRNHPSKQSGLKQTVRKEGKLPHGFFWLRKGQ